MAKEIAEPSFLRRREGRLAAAAASSAGEKANLKSKLGMVAKMKRPAAKLAKKASAKKKILEKRACDHPCRCFTCNLPKKSLDQTPGHQIQ